MVLNFIKKIFYKNFILKLFFFINNTCLNINADDFNFDGINIDISSTQNGENNGGDIKPKKRNKESDIVRLVKKTLMSLGFRDILKKTEEFNDEIAKIMWEKIKNSDQDTPFVKNLKDFIKPDQDTTKEKQTEYMNLVLQSAEMIEYIDKNIEYAKKFRDNIDSLSKKDDTKNIAEIYKQILKNRELMNFLKNLSPDSLDLIDKFFKGYTDVDQRERTCIEQVGELAHKQFLHKTYADLYCYKFKNNKAAIISIYKNIIKPRINEYTADCIKLFYYFISQPNEKDAIEKLKKNVSETTKSIQTDIKNKLEEYGSKDVANGTKRKINACKTSGKPAPKRLL